MTFSLPTSDRDTVVLLHSLGTDHRLWHDQMAVLGKRFNVLAPDSRGHGDTPSAGVIDMEHWVADLDALIEPHRSVHLVGLSMGGVQAIAYAARHPRKVRSLVLADTFAAIDPAAAEIKIEGIRETIGAIGMSRYAERYLAETLTSEVDETVYRRLCSAIAGVSAEDYLRASQATFRASLTDELAQISAPTLVVIGDGDQKTPLALSETLVRGVAGARLSVIPGAGHLANIDAPAAFTEALLGFIESHAGVMPAGAIPS